MRYRGAMNMQCLNLLRAVVAATAMWLAAPVPAAQPPPGGIEAIAAQASAAAPPAARPYDERGWLHRFYAPHRYAPAWSPAQARQALALLQDASAHGLAPEEYDAGTLRAQLDTGAGSPAFDAALTRAMLHYLADLRVGRVRSEFHTTLPDPRLRAFDPVGRLRAALDGDKLPEAVQAAEPALPFYARVKQALARYRALAATEHGPVPAAKKVRPGMPYAGAARLHARLVLLGDLGADAAPPGAVYTPELAEGVRHFQLRHGLQPDGILGRATLEALNVPLDRRVRQLELALERLRWLPDTGPGPLIAVNLPAYRLWAFRDGGASAAAPLEMRVVVGAAVRTPTPLFTGQMRYVEFNPYWNVPRSIALGEMVPELVRNPRYLADNDMELVGAGLAPTDMVDGAALAALRAGKARIRQRPGPKNALGAVKFALPNPMNIYLHSTPARELFERSRRDLSHGCIRVEKPAELAHFVLGDQPGWSLDKVEAAMEPGPMRRVELAAPVPVLLFYATAMVDRDGRVLFARDIYRRDPVLEAALDAHRE